MGKKLLSQIHNWYEKITLQYVSNLKVFSQLLHFLESLFTKNWPHRLQVLKPKNSNY